MSGSGRARLRSSRASALGQSATHFRSYSGLTAFAFLPWLLFGLPGGALADRLDRQRAMSAVNIIRAALVSILMVLIVAGTGQILVLYITAFALGACERRRVEG